MACVTVSKSTLALFPVWREIVKVHAEQEKEKQTTKLAYFRSDINKISLLTHSHLCVQLAARSVQKHRKICPASWGLFFDSAWTMKARAKFKTARHP